MRFAVRSSDGMLRKPETFADWLRLFALTSAAKELETIPLPAHLPCYWPGFVG
jgi:hypothetical protein